MIEAVFTCDFVTSDTVRCDKVSCGGGEYRFTMQGHAGYSSSGEDIVCAGASAIGYALLGYLSNREDLSSFENDVGSAFMEIRCEGEVAEAFRMAYIGLAQLAQAYPAHIEVRNGL